MGCSVWEEALLPPPSPIPSPPFLFLIPFSPHSSFLLLDHYSSTHKDSWARPWSLCTSCTTLQHVELLCNTWRRSCFFPASCNTLQHPATQSTQCHTRNILQHSATPAFSLFHKYVCVYLYTNTRTYTTAHACTHTHRDTHIDMHTYTHTQKHTHTHIH